MTSTHSKGTSPRCRKSRIIYAGGDPALPRILITFSECCEVYIAKSEGEPPVSWLTLSDGFREIEFEPIDIAPSPGLARLERLYDRVMGAMKMFGCVLIL